MHSRKHQKIDVFENASPNSEKIRKNAEVKDIKRPFFNSNF